MRENIVLGNWKQNTNKTESIELLKNIKKELSLHPTKTKIGVIPPALYIEYAVASVFCPLFSVGIQNISKNESGAYTGEIGADMAVSMGVKYALVGHSERRIYFNESSEDLNKKVINCLKNNLTPVYCIGEDLDTRLLGNHFQFIEKQVKSVLFGLTSTQIENVIIAYEPIWAIGTGKTATPNQAQEIHSFIRELVDNQYDNLGNKISILYGGSCKPSTAKQLFSQPDIDGGLIGGASLNASDFVTIVNSF